MMVVCREDYCLWSARRTWIFFFHGSPALVGLGVLLVEVYISDFAAAESLELEVTTGPSPYMKQRYQHILSYLLKER